MPRVRFTDKALSKMQGTEVKRGTAGIMRSLLYRSVWVTAKVTEVRVMVLDERAEFPEIRDCVKLKEITVVGSKVYEIGDVVWMDGFGDLQYMRVSKTGTDRQ